MTVAAFHKGQLQMDLTGCFDQAVVERGHHFLRCRCQIEFPQMYRTMAEHVVGELVIFHHRHVQFQLAEQIRQAVKGERFAVDWIDRSAFLTTLLGAQILVENNAFLFQMEYHVRDHILVAQVGHLVEENCQLAHGLLLFLCCWRFVVVVEFFFSRTEYFMRKNKKKKREQCENANTFFRFAIGVTICTVGFKILTIEDSKVSNCTEGAGFFVSNRAPLIRTAPQHPQDQKTNVIDVIKYRPAFRNDVKQGSHFGRDTVILVFGCGLSPLVTARHTTRSTSGTFPISNYSLTNI
jgi:hypothetical protein